MNRLRQVLRWCVTWPHQRCVSCNYCIYPPSCFGPLCLDCFTSFVLWVREGGGEVTAPLREYGLLGDVEGLVALAA